MAVGGVLPFLCGIIRFSISIGGSGLQTLSSKARPRHRAPKINRGEQTKACLAIKMHKKKRASIFRHHA
jgi:hypothetical protein